MLDKYFSYTQVFTSALLLLCLLGQAEAKINLYAAEVPVHSRSQVDRKQAVLQAFKEVLLKLSPGQTGSIEQININGDLTNLVSSYSYYQLQQDDESELYLNVLFDEKLVNNVAQANDLRLWTTSRPTTSIWVAMQDESGRTEILSADSKTHGRPVKYMEQLGKRWGLPIIFPLMDLEDQLNITSMDLWNQYIEPLKLAAKRYSSHAVLGAKIYQRQDGRWQGLWLFNIENETKQFKTQGFDVDAVMNKAFQRLSSELALHYLSPSDSGSHTALVLSISNIQGLNAYARVIKYLEQVKVVDNIQLHKITPDSLQITVNLRAEKQTLLRALKLDAILVPENTGFNENESQSVALRYVQK